MLLIWPIGGQQLDADNQINQSRHGKNIQSAQNAGKHKPDIFLAFDSD